MEFGLIAKTKGNTSDCRSNININDLATKRKLLWEKK